MVGRRRFLVLAGGALGVGALSFAGLTVASADQPQIDFARSTYGEESGMNDRILVAYASQAGSTSGVADALGKQLASAGATVDVRRVSEVTDLGAYRAAVIGSAIHGGKWLPEAMSFVQANQSRLSQMPTACFLVGMMLAKDPAKYGPEAVKWQEPARQLLKPVAEGYFTGAMRIKDYSLLEGIGMRIFLACVGMAEGDYRDWDAIRAWADQTRPLLLK